MLIAVQPDRPTSSLPSAHMIPKPFVRRPVIQSRVLIIRNDGEDRLHSFLDHHGLKFVPSLPIHRRAQIVESKQEFGGHASTCFVCNPYYNIRLERLVNGGGPVRRVMQIVELFSPRSILILI